MFCIWPIAGRRLTRALGIVFSLGLMTGAAQAAQPIPGLVIELYTQPAQRPSLRADLAQSQLQRLEAWRKSGLLSSYRLLFTRYADAGQWDAMEVLTFPDATALGRWKTVEAVTPAGLAPEAASLISQIVTTPQSMIAVSGASSEEDASQVFLVVPYHVHASLADYEDYLRPIDLQFDALMKSRDLNGYEIHFSTYPIDRPWQSLILLRYHDDEALAMREDSMARVRAGLASNPAFLKVTSDKKAVRDEAGPAVADELGEGGY